MSYTPQTTGGGQYDAFIRALALMDISHHEELKDESVPVFDPSDYGLRERSLRLAHFFIPGKCMVVEECLDEDRHWHDTSVIAIDVYEYGQRPELDIEAETD